MHEPDYALGAPEGFALQFSGHSHGGQVSIPGYTAYTPEGARTYRRGLYSARHHPVYVSSGVGMVGPQFRLFCPPEIALITVCHGEKGFAGTQARGRA